MTDPQITTKLEELLRRTTTSLMKSDRKLESERAARREPIAIVSMACRLPGGIDTPEGFWNVLAEGQDLITPFPERWKTLDVYDSNVDAAGKSYAKEGGFIRDVDLFDASFFGILPREARAMDPQQRLILHTAWEALERAGIVPATLSGSLTGVYVGAGSSDYMSPDELAALDGYAITGNTGSVLSGRLSYTLGLQGPSMTVDTACSSSLVALHLACNALRARECELAIACGVTVMSTPSLFVEFSRLRALAGDGRCKSFSARADGAIWSEACGVLVLKRLSDAMRDGDKVLAVVRGTAVNHDGRSQGLTAPNGPSQQRVIREAISASRLTPADIDAVEAHGTGTPLGDPIEGGALAAVFGPERSPQSPVLLGSSKSNVGHSVAAAGIVGTIKMVLALQEELLPKTLHAGEPSPHIAWRESGLELLQEPRRWKRGQRVRRAGVSAFGISGTNAHVILEEAPALPASAKESDRAKQESRFLPLVMSARDDNALRAQAARWATWLETHPDVALPDLVRTAALHRARFDTQVTVLAKNVDEVREALRCLAQGQAHSALLRIKRTDGALLAALFTGQGSQRAGMGKGLYAAQPTFRGALDEVAAALDRHLQHPILSLMFAEAGSSEAGLLGQTEYAQPALFALEVALYKHWHAWGLRPAMLMGHSVGELSAAHVAGVLTLDDAARLVCARGRLMQACQAGGAMLSIEAAEQEVAACLKGIAGCVDVAALNGPEQTVVSGDEGAVSAVAEHFAARGRITRRLRVSHAFHSAHMDDMLEELMRVAGSCAFSPPQIPIVSVVTGRLASFEELSSPQYWARQARATVRFLDGMHTLHEAGVRTYLECGPDGVLCTLAPACVPHGATIVSSLRKGMDDSRAVASCVGVLDGAGQALDWRALTADASPSLLDVPTYAFQAQRFWREPRMLSESSQAAPERAFWNALKSGSMRDLADLLALPAAASDALTALSPYLCSWHEQAMQPEPLGAQLYRTVWHTESQPLIRQVDLTGKWFVVADRAPEALLQFVTSALRERGGDVTVASVDSLTLCSDASAAQEAGALRGMITLTAFDDAPNRDCPGLTAGLLATQRLIQLLIAGGVRVPLWILTQRAVSVDETDLLPRPEHTSVWGMGRVLAMEHPDLYGGLIDLPEERADETGAQLVASLIGAPVERELALRPRGRYCARFEQASVEVTPSHPWRARGTVLITGGSGALAAHVARWLAERGAQHIVLASRRGQTAAGSVRLVAELQEKGLRATLATCDVSDRAQLAALIEQLQRDKKCPLKAVFHTAGIVEDAPLADLTLESTERVLRAKLSSALHLDELTQPCDLDAFVLFSSMSGLIGNPGQAHYAAANLALDALAERRRAGGLPSVSLVWGPWSDGMVTEQVATRALRRGLVPMPAKEALRCLDAALASAYPVLSIAAFDWSRLAHALRLTRAWPFVRDLAEASDRVRGEPAAQASTGSDWLHAAPAEARPTLILERLHAWMCGTLEKAAVDPDADFVSLGFDSLLTLDLVNEIRGATGVVIYPREVVQQANLRALSDYVALQLAPSAASSTVAAPSGAPLGLLRGPYRKIEASEKLPSIGFVLSAPRSGSTLLRAMLAGHGQLFSPPELHLLPFESMAERKRDLQGSYLDEGLVRAVMQLLNLSGEEALATVEKWIEDDASTREVYQRLINLSAPRLLVDKSPTYAFRAEILEQAENLFEQAKYIHIVRHPYAVVESFCRMRMQELVGMGGSDPQTIGELTWAQSNQNALDLGTRLAGQNRYLMVRYEDLVEHPEAELKAISQFLGFEFEPAMLAPYGEGRMTDGVHASSLPIGDQNFLKHSKIDASLAATWRDIQLSRPLSASSVTLAEKLGYSLRETAKTEERAPLQRVPAIDTNERTEKTVLVDGREICVSVWGEDNAQTVVCLHGYGDQGPVWEEVATTLVAEGYRVVAPDISGHGLSAPMSEVSETQLADFVADLDTMCSALQLHEFSLVGHSMGTMVATAYAAARPERVRDLHLVEPIIPMPGQAKVSERFLRAKRAAPPPAPRKPFSSEAEAIERFRSLHPTMPDYLTTRLAKRILLASQDGYRWRLDVSKLAMSHWISRSDYLALMAEVRVPTTLVYGSKSDRIRREDVEAVGRAMPNVRELTLVGSHNVHYEQPREIAASIARIDSSRAAE